MKARVHVFVSGRVQGVFFRDHTQKFAVSLGLTGWVKNLRDGRVETIAEGEKEKLETFISRLEEGAPLAVVEKVDVDWGKYKGEFANFTITWSGLL